MTPVLLYGELGKRFGRRHSFDLRTPAEAVRALCANNKDFERELRESSSRNVGYKVIVGKDEIADPSELGRPSGRAPIKIVPVVMGSGGGTRLLIGAALIAASFALPGGAAAAPYLFSIGVGFAIGGATSLLFPQQQPEGPQEPAESTPSYSFNGPVNATAQGWPVALAYGKLIVGSVVVSAGITTEEIGSTDGDLTDLFNEAKGTG